MIFANESSPAQPQAKTDLEENASLPLRSAFLSYHTHSGAVDLWNFGANFAPSTLPVNSRPQRGS